MTEKILITGADGFIGSHLVELLLKENISPHNLRLFIEEKSSSTNLPNLPFDIVKGDIRDKKIVTKAMEGVTTIFHLAAITSFASDTYDDYKAINVEGTQHLLDACKGKNIQKFVLFSSIAVFGLPAWTGDIRNWDETHPKTFSDIYGKSKWEAEERVIEAHKKWKIPYTIVRPSSVYGPRDKGQLYGLYKTIKNRQFFMIGSGENKMHFVFVKDLVKGVRQAQLSKSKASDYILAGKEPVAFKDVVKFVAQSINAPLPRFGVGKNVALMLSYVMDSLGKFIGVKSPLFPSRVKVMTTNYYYKIDKARKEINYNPKTSFEEGSKITGKWYLEHNSL